MGKNIFDLLGDAANGVGQFLGNEGRAMFGGGQSQPQQPTPQSQPTLGNSFAQTSPQSTPQNNPTGQPSQNINTLLQAQQNNQSNQNDSSNPTLLQDVENGITNFGKGVVSTGQKVLNTGEMAGTGLVGAGKVAADLVTGNPNQAQQDNANAMQNIQNISNRKTVTGDQGTFITAQQAKGQDGIVKDFVQPVLATAGEITPYVAPYGAIAKAAAPAGALTSDVAQTLADYAVKNGLTDELAPTISSLAGKAATEGVGSKVASSVVKATTTGALNAPIMAGANAVQQYGNTGTIDPSQVAQAGGTGFLLAGGGHLLTDAGKAGVDAVASRVNDINSQPGYNPASGFAKVPSTGKLTIKSSNPLAPENQSKTIADTFGVSKVAADETQKSANRGVDLLPQQESNPSNFPTNGKVTVKSSAKNAEAAVYNTLKDGGSKEDAIAAHQLATGSDRGAASAYVNKVFKAASQAQKGIVRVGDQPRQFAPAGGDSAKAMTDREMKQVVLEAKRRGEGEEMANTTRHAVVDQAIKDGVHGDDENSRFLDSVEHPEDLPEHLQHVSDPEKFANAVQEAKNYTQYTFDSHNRVGAPLDYRQNYLHHNVDLPSKEDAPLPNEMGKSNPNFRKERTFDDLRSLYGAGYKLKYSDARDLYRDYASTAGRSLRQNAMLDYLSKNAEGHISPVSDHEGRIPVDATGNRYSTLRSPGLKDNYASPQLIKQASKFIEHQDLHPVLKAIDAVGQALKQSTLALGGFHDLNMTKRYAFQELGAGLTGQPMRIVRLAGNIINQDKAFWSEQAYNHKMADYVHSGAIDRLTTGNGHLTLNKNLDVGSLSGQEVGVKTKSLSSGAQSIASKPKEVNEFIHHFLFGRKIPMIKVQTAVDEMNRYHIPLKGDLTPWQENKLSEITHGINDQFGGITQGAIAKSGMGKFIERLAILAPDFFGGNVNSLGKMFVGNAKSLAVRQNLTNFLGTIITTGIAAGGVALATGQDPEKAVIDKWTQAFNPSYHEFLNPGIPLPYQKNGKGLEVTSPGSPIDMAVNAVKDPTHFLTARGSSFASGATQFISGKNYYGDPLVDPNITPNPSALDKLGAIAKNDLPIPAKQNIGTGSTPQDITTAILNTLGGKVRYNPDDPKVVAANQYYQTRDQIYNNLSGTDKSAWDVVNPPVKDSNGDYINKPTVFDSSEKASILLKNPNVLTAETAMNKQLASEGQKVDPFFTKLSPDQQQKLLDYQRMELGGASQTNWKTQNDTWYKPFSQDRQAFFSSLPATDPNKPQEAIKFPTPSADVQGMLDKLNTINDNTERSKFINANPSLSDYFDKYGTYVNQVRNAQGLASLRTFPKVDPAANTFMNTYFAADKGTQKIMRNSDPTSFNTMQTYMAQIARYGVDKAASLDELVNPGQDQNAQPTQQYLKDVSNMGKYDIAKSAGGIFSIDPQAAYAQAKAYGGGAGVGAAYAKMAAQKQQNKIIKAASYASKAPNTSVRVMAPRKTMQIAKVIKSGVVPNKSAKGTIRIRRSMNRI